MAIVPNLTDIQSGFLTAAAHNENNQRLAVSLAKAINREGGSDNEMQADLDMALNRIVNLQDATTPYGATNYQQVLDMVSGYLIKAKDVLLNNYSIIFSDGGKLLRVNTEQESFLTVPLHSKAGYVKGTIIHVRQVGVGRVNIVPENPDQITINKPQGEDFTSGQGFGLALINLGANKWDLVKSYTGVPEVEFDYSFEAAPYAEGSYRLPGGLVVKFGSLITDGTELTPVVFEQPFENNCINVNITFGQKPATTAHSLWAEQLTATGFAVGKEGLDNVRVYWQAIGA